MKRGKPHASPSFRDLLFEEHHELRLVSGIGVIIRKARLRQFALGREEVALRFLSALKEVNIAKPIVFQCFQEPARYRKKAEFCIHFRRK